MFRSDGHGYTPSVGRGRQKHPPWPQVSALECVGPALVELESRTGRLSETVRGIARPDYVSAILRASQSTRLQACCGLALGHLWIGPRRRFAVDDAISVAL